MGKNLEERSERITVLDLLSPEVVRTIQTNVSAV